MKGLQAQRYSSMHRSSKNEMLPGPQLHKANSVVSAKAMRRNINAALLPARFWYQGEQ